MFDSFIEQYQKSMKPAQDLMALNAKAMEKLVHQQAAFVTGLVNDGASYSRNLAEQKDLTGLADVQSAYVTDFQEKVYDCARDAYAVANETKEEARDIMRGLFAEAGETTQAAARSAGGSRPAAAKKSSS